MLQPAPGRTMYDATFGRGGHTRAFLKQGARVVALDVDPAAEAEAEKLTAEVGADRFRFHRVNFSDLASVALIFVGNMVCIIPSSKPPI